MFSVRNGVKGAYRGGEGEGEGERGGGEGEGWGCEEVRVRGEE